MPESQVLESHLVSAGGGGGQLVRTTLRIAASTTSSADRFFLEFITSPHSFELAEFTVWATTYVKNA
jgi:hypothetical protein